jgi:ABC-type microcin C transport system permease subunit YejB
VRRQLGSEQCEEIKKMDKIEKNIVKRLYFMQPNFTHAVFHVSIFKEIRRFTSFEEKHKIDLLVGDYKEIPIEELYLPIAYEVQNKGQWSAME